MKSGQTILTRRGAPELGRPIGTKEKHVLKMGNGYHGNNLFDTVLAKEDGKTKSGQDLDGCLLLECSLSASTI